MDLKIAKAIIAISKSSEATRSYARSLSFISCI